MLTAAGELGPVQFFPKKTQLNKLIALQARELQLQNEDYYRVLAYLKVAHNIDETDTDLVALYQERGVKGLKRIKGVGEKWLIY